MTDSGAAPDAHALLDLSRAELDELFTKGQTGEVPDGRARGTAIVAPGTCCARVLATAIRYLLWQGKNFDARAGRLKNRILPFGIEAIAADVRKGPSLSDGRDCIVLDYSKTSVLARHVRDEIRLVAPGLYLGRAYWHGRRIIDFALEF